MATIAEVAEAVKVAIRIKRIGFIVAGFAVEIDIFATRALTEFRIRLRSTQRKVLGLVARPFKRVALGC